MQENIEDLIQRYGIADEETFRDYFNKIIIILTAGKRPSEDKTLAIVGGQPGAGKSRLIRPTNEELGNNAVIIDFDEIRINHPSYEKVSKSYPESVYPILRRDSEKLKDMLIDYLIEKEYSVIYEGALRNTRVIRDGEVREFNGFLQLGQAFKNNGYKVNLNIMAVPRLESYGSTFIRNAYNIFTAKTPRWVEKSAHDEAYDGVLKTVQAFMESKIADKISVFMRGSDVPKKIYSTEERQFRDAILAIQYGREADRRKAVETYPGKVKFVRQAIESRELDAEERKYWEEKLLSWKEVYDEEVEHFNHLKKSSEEQK